MDSQNLQKIIRLRHELHAYPDLSMNEAGTKKRLIDFLRKNTSLSITDRGKWFFCTKLPDAGVKSDIPAIGFRADMDALPIKESLDIKYCSRHNGVSHKCGHDGHSAALAGLALELDGVHVTRPVYLIFQHAEEIGAGGRECANLIEEKHISEIYAFHNLSGYPKDSIVLRRGLTQPASKGLTIYFTGKKSHAGNPEEGKNPSQSVADLITYIGQYLKKPSEGMLLCTIVSVRVGEKNFGVSAGDAELSCTLRAEKEQEMNRMDENLRAFAQKLANRDGLRVSFSDSDFFPETRNHDACLAKVVSCAEKLGKRVIFMNDLWRASEDFGWYLKKCPGAIFYIGNGETYAPLHTAEYDFNDRILETAVDLFRLLIGSFYFL